MTELNGLTKTLGEILEDLDVRIELTDDGSLVDTVEENYSDELWYSIATVNLV